MQALVTQTCVVTLEPFEAKIKEQADLRFVPEAAMSRVPDDEEDEEDVTPASLESPDEIPYANDIIDLGEALAEQLALDWTRIPASPVPPCRTPPPTTARTLSRSWPPGWVNRKNRRRYSAVLMHNWQL